MPYANADDAILYYQIYGSGPTLILLHGNAATHTYFHNQIPVLSKHYKVIAFDARGHGKSTRGDKELTYETLAQDVCELMDDLHIVCAHLLGYSDGANTAIRFALRYPQRTVSLILNSPNLNPKGIKSIVMMQYQLQHRYLELTSAVSKKNRQQLEILELRRLHTAAGRHELKQISCPVLIIGSEHDLIKRDHMKQIARRIPHASYQELQHADAYAAQSKSELFNSMILQYLSSF